MSRPHFLHYLHRLENARLLQQHERNMHDAPAAPDETDVQDTDELPEWLSADLAARELNLPFNLLESVQ